MKNLSEGPPSVRIRALDYMRGFFILVIIVDHLWRWPNLFQYMTGRGELWVSAAEGFIIISGLLVGYVHGYKKRFTPLRQLAAKLIRRGLMLYIWMIITTVSLVAATWYLPMQGAMAYIPADDGNWQLVIRDMLRLDYVHSLTHFLYLYAIYLVASPAALWLLRHGRPLLLVAASLLVWVIGYSINIEWLQWQILFFVPAAFGYHMDAIFYRYRTLGRYTKSALRIGLIVVMLGAFSYSLSRVLAVEPGVYKDLIFTRHPLTLPTIIMAGMWFGGLLSLFQYLTPWLEKTLGWLLPVFGERSLTAYILHSVPLVLCQLWFSATTDVWFNTLLTAACILATWLLMKLPGINRVIPR